MAIKYGISPFVWAPVTVLIPGDMGEPITKEFKAKFKRPKSSDRQLVVKEMEKKTLTDAGLVQRVLLDWSDNLDADGNEVPFTVNNLIESAEELAGLEAALVTSYFTYVFNPKKDDAPVKNS